MKNIFGLTREDLEEYLKLKEEYNTRMKEEV